MPGERTRAASGTIRCTQFVWDIGLEKGGVAQVVRDLCGVLAARGHKITLLTSRAKDIPPNWDGDSPNVPNVVELASSRGRTRWLTRAGLQQAEPFLANADVVHLHSPWGVANLQLARRIRAHGVPYVVTTHGTLDGWSMRQKSIKKRLFLALGARRFIQSAARVHFTAKAEQSQSLRWVPGAAARASIVPCIVDLAPYASLPGPELARSRFPAICPTESTVLFLSRLHPKKGIELLLAATALLHQRGVTFHLLIAGPSEADYRTKLEHLAANHRIGNRVHFLGMVRDAEKLSLYQAADLFVLPTQQENFGLVLVEALACGTPVVTTQGTDIWQELQQAGALIVPAVDTAIANAIEGLIQESSSHDSRGRRGREYVMRWLQTDHVVRQYEEMYADAIGTGGRGTGEQRDPMA